MSEGEKAGRANRQIVVPIPAGSFLMGTSDQQIERLAGCLDAAIEWQEGGRFDREQPQHSVTLEAYVGQAFCRLDNGGWSLGEGEL